VTNKAKYWLEQLPFVEVVTFATGDLALPFIKTCLGEGGRVDLVMCAVGKIDEEKNVSDKSGLHLLDALTRDKDTKGIPVVLVGNISPLEMTEAVRHGCDTFLKKPITKDLTVKKAASLLQNMAQRRKTSLLFDRAQKYKELLEKMRKSQEASNNNTPELKDKNADVDQPSSGNLGNRTLSLTIKEETTHDPIMVLSQVSQESISPHNASTMTTSSEDGP
jgi:response regulator RpfG family c-di-GMP phosphodiesterase